MNAVTQVAHRYGFTCRWAGSVNKHTYVWGYSDVDIWVETYNTTVTMQMRQAFANEVVETLWIFGLYDVQEPIYKPVATAFSTADIDTDVIFSRAEWSNQTVSPRNDDFHCRLDRQRAVRALKIVSKKNAPYFPKMMGLAMERLVIYVSKKLDQEYQDHVEYKSGLLLFRTCLFEFAFAKYADELVQKVAAALPPPTQSYQWRLSQPTFEEWRTSSMYLLASIHELRVEGRSCSLSLSAFSESLCLEPRTFSRQVFVDDLNRFTF
jgi:hypothetical protein